MPTPSQRETVLTQIVTSVVIATSTGGGVVITPTQTVAHTGPNSANVNKSIPIIAGISGGSLLLIFALAWYLRRCEKMTPKQLEGNRMSSLAEETAGNATYDNMTSSALIASGDIVQREIVLDDKFTKEIQPEVQQTLYIQSMGEAAPTSNINLENHLQRVYGDYTTWTHEFVMEWARLKRVHPAVVEILKNYRINGALIATLDVNSLKEKCDVQDFRLRAKFLQAVEFLKDSSSQSASSGLNGEDSLPQYEGNGNNHAT
ncbi:hypothetical protein HDU76_006353 [Blyttiomyces sp. JEL0837]|nr:hypothetical protein HDU76_006353 [Blyttiomyces sp. JEL0837]